MLWQTANLMTLFFVHRSAIKSVILGVEPSSAVVTGFIAEFPIMSAVALSPLEISSSEALQVPRASTNLLLFNFAHRRITELAHVRRSVNHFQRDILMVVSRTVCQNSQPVYWWHNGFRLAILNPAAMVRNKSGRHVVWSLFRYYLLMSTWSLFTSAANCANASWAVTFPYMLIWKIRITWAEGIFTVIL